MTICIFYKVGDRPFTDIVYGNRNGFLTVLVEPLSRTEEPFIVRQVRIHVLIISLNATVIHLIFSIAYNACDGFRFTLVFEMKIACTR